MGLWYWIFWWFAGCNDPKCDPDKLNQELRSDSPETHFSRVFEKGRIMAQTWPIDTAIECGSELGSSDFIAYIDGIAHEYSFSIQPIEHDIKLVQSLSLESSHESVLLDGLIAQITQNYRGDAKRILPLAEKVQKHFPTQKLENGIRIGIRLSQDLTMNEKIELIQTYPIAMQGALIEEHGWDFGDHKRIGKKLRLQKIPERLHCHYAHGFARGLYLRLSPIRLEQWMEFLQYSQDLQQACSSGFWLGVARGIKLNNKPGNSFESYIQELPSKEHQTWMNNISKFQSNDEDIWNISLLNGQPIIAVLEMKP